jgi:2-oxoisovalerate dehydrogenase E1 component alpha subunit
MLPTTTTMTIVDPQVADKFPMYRVTDTSGKVLPGATVPDLGQEEVQKMYRTMGRIQAVDDIFYNAQRQGRVSFYMQNDGEEAIHVGTASALQPQDMILAQYREVGVLLWRGFSVQQLADQCFSNEKDLGKGRMMPVHYGSKELNFQTISSPLTTQLPQAAGAAYAMKLAKMDAVTVVYFGDGAASEGDFHAGMNFAATLEAPCVFICRNNGYAISTPVKDQFRGDGIISRAAGYGMYCIRVDGNDFLAVHQATKAARELALEKSRPVLIEFMTYRRGHHSTSDDSSRYRDAEEVEFWNTNHNPMQRFRAHMESKGWWDQTLEDSMRETERAAVLTALETAEVRPKPPMEELFEDVYHEKPAHLVRQLAELKEHVAKYPEHYAGDGH